MSDVTANRGSRAAKAVPDSQREYQNLQSSGARKCLWCESTVRERSFDPPATLAILAGPVDVRIANRPGRRQQSLHQMFSWKFAFALLKGSRPKVYS